jgi:hydroxyacylglutathione hydrolase
MIIETFITTPFAQNTRVIACPETRRAICVDPGDSADIIAAFIKENDFVLQAIALTHAHLDHIGGVSGLREIFPVAEILLHKEDKDLYYSLPQQPIFMGIAPHQLKALGLEYDVPPRISRFWQDGEIYAVGSLDFKIIHAPGHTRGHIVLFEERRRKLFGGDCLFAGSIGRTDLPGGDYDELMRSINEKILPLGDDVEVYTGHGADTTVGLEKSTNPFLTGAYEIAL